MSQNRKPAELRGALAEGVLPGILRALYVGRRTGILHVTKGSDRGSIVFVKGQIAHGDTTVPGCHMGEAMVRHGRLAQADLDRATQIVRQTKKRLGQVLLDLGILDAAGLEDALALHVREVLLCIFSWDDGSYAFEEQAPEVFRGYDQPLRLSTGELILDAVWSVTDPDVVRYALGDLDQVLVLTTDPFLRFQQISLTPTDGYVLSRVDGTLSAREILAIVPVDPAEAERSLFGLLCVGMLEYLPRPSQPAPPPRSLRDEILEASRNLSARDHFDVLGVGREANEAEIRAAYFRLARRFHPDAGNDPALADLRDRLEALFERLAAAYKVLGDPDSRARYESHLIVASLGPALEPEEPPPPSAPAGSGDPALAAQQVDELLAKAEQDVRQARYWDAIVGLEEALPASRGKSRQRIRVLLAQCYLKNPKWRQRAEQELLAAIEEEADSPDAHYFLGIIYKAAGLGGRAAAMFRRTLELRPRHAEAAAELAALPTEATPPTGLLKKIFH